MEPADRALTDDRVLITNNVVDFERIRRSRIADGCLMRALVCTSDAAFPRDRRFVGRIIDALDKLCARDALTSGGVEWLRPVPTR